MTGLPLVEACGGISRTVVTGTGVTENRQGTLW